MSKQLPVIHALWIGDYLGSISRACLTSFVMRGHQVHLHTYGEIKDLPEGITVKDANEIIDKSKIIKHKKTGSYALFSDIFRYELLRQTGDNNVYVDCDVYCIKPLSIPDHGYLLGYEEDNQVNGAILALPSESPLLNSLLNVAYDPMFIPPWYTNIKKNILKIQKILGFGKGIENMRWGTLGPTAITYFAKKMMLEEFIQPIDIFYPIHYQQVIGYLTDPSLTNEDVITHRTVCIHLYNEMLKNIDLNNLKDGSILNKILINDI